MNIIIGANGYIAIVENKRITPFYGKLPTFDFIGTLCQAEVDGIKFKAAITSTSVNGELATDEDDLKAKLEAAFPNTGDEAGTTSVAWTNVTDKPSLYTQAEVDAAINALVNSAPGALDTLKELADALGDDANFATTVNNNIALRQKKLVSSAVKTSTYAATAFDFIPVDTTSGNVIINLSGTYAEGDMIAIKHVIQGGTNSVTINCGGSDVFNKTGGSTALTLPLLNQAVLLQYKATGGIWYVIADDIPLSQLDTRFQAALGYTPENASNKDTDSTFAANSDTKYPSQKAVRALANLHDIFEGRHYLRNFFDKLYTFYVTPTTNIVILCWGDSVASHIWKQFCLILSNFFNSQYRIYSGATAIGLSTLSFESSTGTIVDSGSLTVDQTVYDGTGGKADFTYLPGGNHITMSNGATLTFNYGQATGLTNIDVYFVIGPSMGSALVEILNETSVLQTSATQNLSNATVGAIKVSFTGLSTTIKYKIRITATNTVVHLLSVAFKPGSVIPMNFARGGSTLTQNNYSNKTILSYLISNLSPSLLFLEAKDENASVSVPATMTTFNSYTTMSKIVIGSLPDSSLAATQIANNKIFRDNALANGCAYFDGYEAIGSYAELQRLGWISDDTHPLDPANIFVANLIFSGLGLHTILGAVEKRAIDHTYNSNNVLTNKLQLLNGDASFSAIDVLINAGGGSPGTVHAQNIKRVVFSGANGTSTSAIEKYDSTHVQPVDASNGNVAGIRVSDLIINGVTVSNLGAANLAGKIRYATNARKSGEGAGAGTGMPVFSDGNGTWRTFDGNAVTS